MASEWTPTLALAGGGFSCLLADCAQMPCHCETLCHPLAPDRPLDTVAGLVAGADPELGVVVEFDRLPYRHQRRRP